MRFVCALRTFSFHATVTLAFRRRLVVSQVRQQQILFESNEHYPSDDHDVLSFSAYSLKSEASAAPSTMPQQEKEKFEKEFEQMWEQFEKEKETFRKEHPDKVKDDMNEYAKYVRISCYSVH